MNTNKAQNITHFLFTKSLNLNSIKYIQLLLLCIFASTISGCQTLTPNTIYQKNHANVDYKFNITGKLGVIYSNESNEIQRASAYYAWSQFEDQYDIQITGIFGIGKTHIYGNFQSSHLTNSEGDYQAESPEELLYKTVGWIAPISDLPTWILGKASQNSSNNVFDPQNRLISSKTQSNNGNSWQVKFYYREDKKRPYKLKIQEVGKELPTKITLTIDFL